MIEEVKKERNSNFELLRIFAMFLIILSHFAIHSRFTYTNLLSFNTLFIKSSTMTGKIGVNLFV